MYISPRGLYFVLPVGPAMPVVEIHILLLVIEYKFLTINLETSSLTAPCLLIMDLGTLRILNFELFEYVTKPRSNILDTPGTVLIK